MPPGYSIPQASKKLEEKLRAQRADELAKASDTDRKRIEKEIRAEVKQQIKKLYPREHWFGRLLW